MTFFSFSVIIIDTNFFKELVKNGYKGQKNDGTKEEKVSLEEKIESLVEWRKKYPRATIVPGVSRDVFESYAKTEEKQNQLFEEYEKMREYYKYITIRKSQGKLNEDRKM